MKREITIELTRADLVALLRYKYIGRKSKMVCTAVASGLDPSNNDDAIAVWATFCETDGEDLNTE